MSAMTWYVIRRSTGEIVDEILDPTRLGEYPEEFYRITDVPTNRQLKAWRWRNST